jgi:hypothetical protein
MSVGPYCAIGVVLDPSSNVLCIKCFIVWVNFISIRIPLASTVQAGCMSRLAGQRKRGCWYIRWHILSFGLNFCFRYVWCILVPEMIVPSVENEYFQCIFSMKLIKPYVQFFNFISTKFAFLISGKCWYRSRSHVQQIAYSKKILTSWAKLN